MPRTTENTGEGRGSGHKGPAKGFAFGVASVTQALHGTSFPISKEDLICAHGKEEVNWTKDSSERLEDLLRDVDKDEFLSVADVASAVSEAHRNADGEEEE
jgi:H2-forming N5,N10-methylenetetrahydromethanopterin dehydrogenase-like enzyme